MICGLKGTECYECDVLCLGSSTAPIDADTVSANRLQADAELLQLAGQVRLEQPYSGPYRHGTPSTENVAAFLQDTCPLCGRPSRRGEHWGCALRRTDG